MFCDANGTPNANGAYEMRDGRLELRKSRVLQPGESLHYNIMMLDGTTAPSSRVSPADSYSEMRKAVNQIRDARYQGYPCIIGSETPPTSPHRTFDAAPAMAGGDVVAAIRAARYR